ncbi:MAG: metallophosphoesterase [Pseudomonadota bacterium]
MKLKSILVTALLAGALALQSAIPAATASERQNSWDGVERIVAIGDVHGDYNQFHALLTAAGLIGKRDKWTGGETHLVQVGDIPDRGPDTRKAMDLLMKLEKQAKRAGGAVHALVGNHEAMNMTGDLRYVHPGEYAAFAERSSQKRLDTYYGHVVDWLKKNTPKAERPDFEGDFRNQWYAEHPLGFVEHRFAWAPDGKYGRWVAENNTAIRINDTLFVHGGLSPKYANWSLDEINAKVRKELKDAESQPADALINADDGPLWYRGLAYADTAEPEARTQIDLTLTAQSVKRIVIGHTPLTGAVLPRFDAKVIAIDVGLSAHYGSGLACLVIEGDEIYTLHHGEQVRLPQDDKDVEYYLQQLALLDPNPSRLKAYLEKLRDAPAPEEAGDDAEDKTLR